MAGVRFEHVYKSFEQVEIVYDVSMQIKDQEFLVLVGPSGSGKSTCLRLVAGLEEPSAGRISIGDRQVNGVDPKDRNIAMVFQNYALYPHMNVFDNVAFGLKLRHVPAQEINTRVQEAAEVLGLEQLLQRKPKQLSGGQRQRVALGRAIVRQADVFLMDEPLSNLDAQLRVATRAEIIKLHRRIQTTVIYVTHDQVEAMTMGDRIAVLNEGLIQQLDSSSGEGFSKKLAVFAVKHIKVNWYQQAVESAKGYMQMGGFSYSSLVQQLDSSAGEGFTYAQAVYAAKKVGL